MARPLQSDPALHSPKIHPGNIEVNERAGGYTNIFCIRKSRVDEKLSREERGVGGLNVSPLLLLC